MNVSFEKWKEWDAVKCVIGENELIIGISAGPRILSFSFNGGENILYEDHTGFGVADWRLYGGHRFTIAPENEDSYYPDNEQCEIKFEDSTLYISAKQRPDGLTLSLVISESSEGGFYIDHVLVNNGKTDWTGALWAIACVPRTHILTGACDTKQINFWPGTDGSKWRLANGIVSVENGNFRAKAGWYSAAPELKAITRQGAFIISSPDVSTQEYCVDNHSNVEIFVCAYWAELETLSEKLVVNAGDSASHRQRWRFKPA